MSSTGPGILFSHRFCKMLIPKFSQGSTFWAVKKCCFFLLSSEMNDISPQKNTSVAVLIVGVLYLENNYENGPLGHLEALMYHNLLVALIYRWFLGTEQVQFEDRQQISAKYVW